MSKFVLICHFCLPIDTEVAKETQDQEAETGVIRRGPQADTIPQARAAINPTRRKDLALTPRRVTQRVPENPTPATLRKKITSLILEEGDPHLRPNQAAPRRAIRDQALGRNPNRSLADLNLSARQFDHVDLIR